MGLGWGPRGPHTSPPKGNWSQGGPEGIMTPSWRPRHGSMWGGGVQVWAGPPQLTPKGGRQHVTQRVMNNLLAVWTQGGGVQVGRLNYPSHNARRHVEYAMLGVLTVMLG